MFSEGVAYGSDVNCRESIISHTPSSGQYLHRWCQILIVETK